MKITLLTSLLVLLSIILEAQEVPPELQAKLDSINLAREKNREAQKKLKRDQFYLEISQLDADSTFSIDMRNLGADSLPDFSRFTKLKELDLSGNNFTTLSKKSLPNAQLKWLDLSDNPWKKIKFRRNDSLSTLNLNKIGYSKIPRSIKKLKGLKFVQFEHNHLTRVPRYIRKFENLQEVTFNFNEISLSERDVRILQNVQLIQFIHNELYELPENFGILKNAKKINLAQNHLSYLPASFSELKKLESIIFYKNEFEKIPSEIFSLESLEELDYYYNELLVIPDSLNQLKNLKVLFLAYNSISEIPESLMELNHLKKLYLHHNQILAAPKWLGDFPHLEVLDLGFNKIVAIPDLSNAVELIEVDVQQNLLSDLPWSLLELPNLEIIYIRDNPFLIEENSAVRLRDLIEDRQKEGVKVIF